ncbi:F0F1 ATP synthase subunit A [Proteiniborus sp. MB09-C3]|uniref:F0F1 ATP synthase subunit A n=1 Tax=Proteiniborus sp. MB09-C3 TaxID=3050072 RepID=UPI002556E237|nr:F0F1 ATP synthase subunit A [Proteiniborus sp. MB09-C3]WIV12183.1 F0F1 ATP synthase subunit A [Proteiniborus sp. MB09-C3]
MGIKFMMNGKEIYIHDTVVNSWIIVILLSIFAIVVNRKLKKANIDEKPTGLLNVAEILVEGLESLVRSAMGPTRMNFMPYVGTLAMYLVCANLFGLLGFTPPTSDYNVTLALALITFVMMHFNGIKSNGILGYLKGFFEPMPFLFPINILGELATPISLSFRLFGNILSGTIIMALIYSGLNSLSMFITPFVAPVFHAYFDVFSGLIQTLIFTMLTMLNIANKMGDEPSEVIK